LGSKLASICQAFQGSIYIDPNRYIVGKCDHVLINQIKIKANIVIINKPLLIKDFLGGTSPLYPSDVNLSTFERIVDSSGVNRDYLPPQQDLASINAVQMRINSTSILCPMIFADRNGGYTWLFPLGGKEAHIGSLSPNGINIATQKLDSIRKMLAASPVLFTCSAKICRKGPVYPFIDGKVWGLAEAIGLVDPIGCAGIIPAMTSAQLMSKNCYKAHKYENLVLRYYSYMTKEAKMIEKLARGEKLLYRDLLLPQRAFEKLGIYPSLL
jgi:hypothetical protein